MKQFRFEYRDARRQEQGRDCIIVLLQIVLCERDFVNRRRISCTKEAI